MDNFGIISSIDSLPVREGQYVKDFDAAQKAAKIAARAAKKAATEALPVVVAAPLDVVPDGSDATAGGVASLVRPDGDPGPEPVAEVLQLASGTVTQPKGAIVTREQAHVLANDFLTFDSSRKHLARVIGTKGKKIIVRRFDKKSMEWGTKLEKLDQNADVVLSSEEAEKSFPGCVAAWDKAAQSSTGNDGKVTRQMSPNSCVPVVVVPVCQSVSEFLAAYTDKKKTIDDLSNEFVDKASEAKQVQDNILPHLSFMQSLLSKRGPNHKLVIAAQRKGHKIPWWTDYFKAYKGKLWESLRTMERRIAAYRDDRTVREPKHNAERIPPFNKAARKALIEGNHKAVEIVAALEAGRDAKQEIANFKAVMDAKRLDDIMADQNVEPDYKGILQGILRLVEENRKSLPADFVKAVGELAKRGNATPANDGDWSCSICGVSIKKSADKQIENHFLSHYSDETNSEGSVSA